MALVKSSFAALEGLQRRVGELVGPRFREELAMRLAGTAVKLLADEFNESRDPYGQPWKPVYRRRRRDRMARARRASRGLPQRADKPLVDTGRLRASAVARPSGTTVRVLLPVEYASYHQDGTPHIARRQIVPDAAGGMGAIWSEAFRKEIERKVTETMGKR